MIPDNKEKQQKKFHFCQTALQYLLKYLYYFKSDVKYVVVV